MPDTLILRIAVPSPLRRLFDYLPPEHLTASERSALVPGIRIRVPFGNRKVVGILIETSTSSDIEPERLKAADATLDQQALFPPALLSLLNWASHYYQHSLGDCWHTVIPTLLRKGNRLEMTTQPCLRLTTKGKGLPHGALKKAQQQQALLGRLQQCDSWPTAQAREHGYSRSIINALIDKQLIEEVPMEISVEHPVSDNILREASLPLNDQQQTALNQIREQQNRFAVLLLEGVTGSGKTEVYLQAITEVLQQKKQALVLVPEIGLTPQTVERFRQRFNCPIGVIHSGLNEKERLDSWLLTQRGAAGILIGTRSAIFTPMAAPGIIIVDEEHDLSFKQQDGFRYSARDLAVMRGQYEQIPVVLGSATPSLESLHNAQYQRYQHLRLTSRAGNAREPQFRILDLRHQPLNEGFSTPLIEAIDHTIKAQQQALVFLNRRGFAPVLMCHDCGWIALCRACEMRMTVHRQPVKLHCHHCERIEPLPDRCPQCKSQPLQTLGQGTERSEAALALLFPTTPLYRIDRDTTQRKFAMQEMVSDINQGGAALLVGTQMLAKGHHFPHVTLVAMLDIDSGLFGVDFRAPERMGQLLIQVAGRAGRAENPGTVYVQTHLPEHPLITTLTSRGYHPFAQNLLAERKQTGLPPCGFMAMLRCDHNSADLAEKFLRIARQLAEQLPTKLQVVGPMPAPIGKKANRYRYQLLVHSHNRQALQNVLPQWITAIEQLHIARQVRWSLDVDPQDMS